MSEAKLILRNVLVALQFYLGFWQIVKHTPFGAFMKCLVPLWVSLLPLGLGSLLSPTYTQLKRFRSNIFIFKEAPCYVTTPADQSPVQAREMSHETPDQIEMSYLGDRFHLQRREGNKLLVKGKMLYYITDTIWSSVLDMAKVADNALFLKGHKQFIWEGVFTGGVMSLYEVLDCLIIENQTIKLLGNSIWFLPANLSVSEEKLLKFLNLAGLSLQTKNRVHWLIPTLLSFTAAVLEFNTRLRVWLYTKINSIFCWAMQVIIDSFPLLIRATVYTLGRGVENLRPSNDLRWRVVRGDICAVIGGGAKAHREGATLVQADPNWLRLGETEGFVEFNCGPIKLHSRFDATRGKCESKLNYSGPIWYCVEVDCNRDEYMKIIGLISCMAKNRCGSLKSCNPNNTVLVRGFSESVQHYAKSGFPAVYELEVKNVVVK